MKKITVSVTDETHRRARMKAAERESSVSALVRDFLAGLGADETDVDRGRRSKVRSWPRFNVSAEAIA